MTHSPIILFDGVCNLCNRSVQLVIRHDAQGVFRFASLQSEVGQRLLQQSGLDTTHFSSLVLVDRDKVFTQSDAALKIALYLGGFWRLLSIFRLVPRFIRNAVYAWIARNRYQWFGKTESCWLPTPELKARFL